MGEVEPVQTEGVERELPLLEIEGLGVERGGRHVLRGVSLSVPAGSFVSIVGPNGGGKSTLLQALIGEVAFSGTARMHARRSGRIGYVPQSLHVDESLPIAVSDFLGASRQRRPVLIGQGVKAREALASTLRMTEVDGLLSRRLGELSGGELRRVLLANALDPIPEMLLLDEPGAGLDEGSARTMRNLLEKVYAEHDLTTLLVSHDVDEVARLSTHVAHVDGTLRDFGPSSQILGDPPAFPHVRRDERGSR